MGLELGTYISDLDAANPIGSSDNVSVGDDHIRLIKSFIKASFVNIAGAMLSTHTELNILDGADTGGAAAGLLAATSKTAQRTYLDAAAKAGVESIAGVWTHTANLIVSYAAAAITVNGTSGDPYIMLEKAGTSQGRLRQNTSLNQLELGQFNAAGSGIVSYLHLTQAGGMILSSGLGAYMANTTGSAKGSQTFNAKGLFIQGEEVEPPGAMSIVTGSRAVNTVYENTTGYRILVTISFRMVNDYNITYFYSDSNAAPTTLIGKFLADGTTNSTSFSFYVANGDYYKFSSGSAQVQVWAEST